MEGALGSRRIILIDPVPSSLAVLSRRLEAQGYVVDGTEDPAAGAAAALASPPLAVVADLWMPAISGVQICRLLSAEPATAEVPVILRATEDDPRNRFWARRAGAAAYVSKGRVGELVLALADAAARAPAGDGFFMQLPSGAVDVRDRIASHLDAALFESEIAGEVRALARCASVERVFDLLAQFVTQVVGYRWLSLQVTRPALFAVHHHPKCFEVAEREARAAFGEHAGPVAHIEDEDALECDLGPPALVRPVVFAQAEIARVAIAPAPTTLPEAQQVLAIVARELGGAVRMAALVEDSARLASADPLTGIMNRRSFRECALRAIALSLRHGTPFAMLLMDVDKFKVINDTWGHGVGDRVLCAIASQLAGAVRASDLVARWGGEEFVVALPSADEEGATAAAERLRARIESASVLDETGQLVPATVSIGIAVLRQGDDFEALVQRADGAMYAAKSAGRNRVCLAPDAGGTGLLEASA